MLKAIFFDLDGTLLPMDEQSFVKVYFKMLYEKIKFRGYYEEEKLYKDIYKGVKLMMENDGTSSNEKVFWDFFENEYGKRVLEDIQIFEEFYKNEFKNTKKACGENPYARLTIEFVKSKNLKCVLSTNPIFPMVGTLTRMSFIGLNENDFDYITAYENSSYSKPNPMYFKSILEKLDLKSEEVILFGNNVQEDYKCAKACGIDCVLVGDYIIGDSTGVKHIKLNEIINYIEDIINNK